MKKNDLYASGGILDPFGYKADGGYIGILEVCLDALGNQNGIAETADIDGLQNHQRFNRILDGKFSWEKFNAMLDENYLQDLSWLTEFHYPQEPWENLKIKMESQPGSPFLKEVFNLCLADQLIAQKSNVLVTGQWLEFPNGNSPLNVYYVEYSPAAASVATPTIFLLPGLGASPHFYRDLAIKWAANGVRAILIDDPAGRFSYGWEGSQEPKNIWGYSGDNDFLQLRRDVLNQLVQEKNTSSFAVACFSDGLPSLLSWQNKYAEKYPGQFKGIIDLTGTWALSQKPGYAGLLSVDALGRLSHHFSLNTKLRDIGNHYIFQAAGSNSDSRAKLRTLWSGTVAEKGDGASYGLITAWTYKKASFYSHIGKVKDSHPHYFFLDPFDDIFIDPVRAIKNFIETHPDQNNLHIVCFGSSGDLGKEEDPRKRKMIEKIENQLKTLIQGGKVPIEWRDTSPVGHMLHLSPVSTNVIVEKTKTLF